MLAADFFRFCIKQVAATGFFLLQYSGACQGNFAHLQSSLHVTLKDTLDLNLHHHSGMRCSVRINMVEHIDTLQAVVVLKPCGCMLNVVHMQLGEAYQSCC